MIITARLEEATVKELLDEILPAKVMLGEEGDPDRWIQIERPSHIDFVAGEGLRVATNGELRWQAIGVPIGVTFTSAQLMLKPLIVPDQHGGQLVFQPSLEALDLKNVPAFLDSGVLSLINGRLASQGDALAWHYGRALGLTFSLPATIVPLEQLHLSAHAGTVEVLTDAVVFSLSVAVSFTRGPTGQG